MAFSIVILLAGIVLGRQKYARYPPGPSPLPVVGNIFDFPQKHLGREFAALSRKFGAFIMHDLDVHLPLIFVDIRLLVVSRQETFCISTCLAKTSSSSAR